MSVNMPIWVNDETIGQLIITRQDPSTGNEEPWKKHRYKYEARQYEPEERIYRGEIRHAPIHGMWVLLSRVTADIPQWSTPTSTVGP